MDLKSALYHKIPIKLLPRKFLFTSYPLTELETRPLALNALFPV